MRLNKVSIPLLLLLIPAIMLAYPNNPPNSLTGAPGEGTCNGCHGSYGLNSGPGTLSIEGMPENYTPGETYPVTVSVTQGGNVDRWGFELAAKNASQYQGGQIIVTQPTYTVSGTSAGITYLKQRSAGTFNGQTGGASWSFDWVAPALDAGDITLYLCGMASNGTGGTSGDYNYTTSFTSIETFPCESDGDVNNDNVVDILDIVTIVGFILGNDTPDNLELCAGDVNEDGMLNVLDIIGIVNIIVGRSGPIDANALLMHFLK